MSDAEKIEGSFWAALKSNVRHSIPCCPADDPDVKWLSLRGLGWCSLLVLAFSGPVAFGWSVGCGGAMCVNQLNVSAGFYTKNYLAFITIILILVGLVFRIYVGRYRKHPEFGKKIVDEMATVFCLTLIVVFFFAMPEKYHGYESNKWFRWDFFHSMAFMFFGFFFSLFTLWHFRALVLDAPKPDEEISGNRSPGEDATPAAGGEPVEGERPEEDRTDPPGDGPEGTDGREQEASGEEASSEDEVEIEVADRQQAGLRVRAGWKRMNSPLELFFRSALLVSFFAVLLGFMDASRGQPSWIGQAGKVFFAGTRWYPPIEPEDCERLLAETRNSYGSDAAAYIRAFQARRPVDWSEFCAFSAFAALQQVALGVVDSNASSSADRKLAHEFLLDEMEHLADLGLHTRTSGLDASKLCEVARIYEPQTLFSKIVCNYERRRAKFDGEAARRMDRILEDMARENEEWDLIASRFGL